jgi:hypothetical protein
MLNSIEIIPVSRTDGKIKNYTIFIRPTRDVNPHTAGNTYENQYVPQKAAETYYKCIIIAETRKLKQAQLITST